MKHLQLLSSSLETEKQKNKGCEVSIEDLRTILDGLSENLDASNKKIKQLEIEKDNIQATWYSHRPVVDILIKGRVGFENRRERRAQTEGRRAPKLVSRT